MQSQKQREARRTRLHAQLEQWSEYEKVKQAAAYLILLLVSIINTTNVREK